MLNSSACRMIGMCLVAGIFAFSACAEKKVEAPGKPTKDTSGKGKTCGEGMIYDDTSKACIVADPGSTTDPNGASSQSFALCKSMMNQAILAKAPFDTITKKLCGEENYVGKVMRNATYIYKEGSTKTTVTRAVEPQQQGALSLMKLSSSILAKTTPKKYFDMMHLELYEPEKFKTAGYEYNTYAEYTIKSKVSDSELTYHYVNRVEEGAPVDYEATARFITLKENVAYAVATKWQDSATNATIKDLTALMIINQLASDSSLIEIFSFSDQTYENNGQHDTTVNKAGNEASAEQKRSYNNAVKTATAMNLTGNE